MTKLRGKQIWNHKDVYSELLALEIELDSLSQKGCPVSKQLGRVRSILLRVGQEQKTLKRWTKPAPNQITKMIREKAKQLERRGKTD
jgi:hypothetical protein